MHPLQGAIYGLVIKLADFIFSPSVGAVVIPVITLGFLLRFLRWSHAVSRGEREETLREEVVDSVGIARARARRAMGQDDPYQGRGLYRQEGRRRGRRW